MLSFVFTLLLTCAFYGVLMFHIDMDMLLNCILVIESVFINTFEELFEFTRIEQVYLDYQV